MDVSLNHISFSYEPGKTVLDRIDTHVAGGEFVALVGPNGSGKSTLIKCLNGILKVDKGEVRLDQTPVHSFSALQIARKVAYVPQTEQKMQPMPVFDTVLMGRKPWIKWRPSAEDLQQTSAVMERLGLQNIAQKQVTQLSGGQQQRVFIARALAQQPRLLLLDEPTANLDLRYQIELLTLLKELAEQGLTIIMAMHDINMAALYCNRLVMMKEGKIFADGGQDIFSAELIEKLYDVRVRVIRQNQTAYIVPDIHSGSARTETGSAT